MSELLLSVKGVGKSYSSYPSNLKRFASWFQLGDFRQEHWALRNISFQVPKGKALGIIGSNGAGKSTLLKVITGVTQSTEGLISTRGSISAILELGIGFNPELTGRQNVILSGGLMGLSGEQLDQLIPSIQDFAEIGDFFEQPLRVYSSGMTARLAFSLATAIRPDLLIVDEVLSVGDSYFQHKSYDRIQGFRDQGSSILLVTHSLNDVRVLCDQAILLDGGEVLKDGLPDEVVDYYSVFIAEKENAKLSIEQKREKSGWLTTESGTREAEVRSLELLDAVNKIPINTVRVGQELEIEVKVHTVSPIPRLILGHRITNPAGHVVWGTNTWHTNQVLMEVDSDRNITFRLNFTCTLGPGSYAISFGVVSSDTHLEDCYHKKENALVFDVIHAGGPYFIGSSYINMEISIEETEKLVDENSSD